MAVLIKTTFRMYTINCVEKWMNLFCTVFLDDICVGDVK